MEPNMRIYLPRTTRRSKSGFSLNKNKTQQTALSQTQLFLPQATTSTIRGRSDQSNSDMELLVNNTSFEDTHSSPYSSSHRSLSLSCPSLWKTSPRQAPTIDKDLSITIFSQGLQRSDSSLSSSSSTLPDSSHEAELFDNSYAIYSDNDYDNFNLYDPFDNSNSGCNLSDPTLRAATPWKQRLSHHSELYSRSYGHFDPI